MFATWTDSLLEEYIVWQTDYLVLCLFEKATYFAQISLN